MNIAWNCSKMYQITLSPGTSLKIEKNTEKLHFSWGSVKEDSLCLTVR